MNRTHGVTHYSPDGCFGCKILTTQVQSTPAFQPHFNWSVGSYVSTNREFQDQLKRCSERNSIATGLDHDYQPRYQGDIPQGDIQATEKILHDTAVADRTKDRTFLCP